MYLQACPKSTDIQFAVSETQRYDHSEQYTAIRSSGRDDLSLINKTLLVVLYGK